MESNVFLDFFITLLGGGIVVVILELYYKWKKSKKRKKAIKLFRKQLDKGESMIENTNPLDDPNTNIHVGINQIRYVKFKDTLRHLDFTLKSYFSYFSEEETRKILYDIDNVNDLMEMVKNQNENAFFPLEFYEKKFREFDWLK